MTLLSGLLYSTPYRNIQEVKHTKYYQAQHKEPSNRSLFGYEIIKLDEDIQFSVGWRPDAMKTYYAKKGDYLIQSPMQPPTIIKTWKELRKTYHIFRNTKQK